MAHRRRAVVLLSGGLDSATVLALALHEGHEVHALSLSYGQRHAIELEAARDVARSMGVSDHVVASVDTSVFGARTTVFLASALALAESIASDDVWIGLNALDQSGYPDRRPEYVRAFTAMGQLATKRGVEGQRLRIHTPLIDRTKAEIVRLGLELGVDYSLTRSCDDPSPSGGACGECDSCLLRLRAFAEHGLVDPAPYSVPAEV